MTVEEKREFIGRYCNRTADCTKCVCRDVDDGVPRVIRCFNEEMAPEKALDEAIALIKAADNPEAVTHIIPPQLKAPKETVNHPDHYQGPHECIEIMKAMFGKEAVKHFCMCNAFKYRFRADKKNGAEDIKKAEWYETYLINLGGIDDERQ